MKRFVLLTCLLVTAFSLAAQETFSTVEERMTGKEFMATGLNKLSEEELAALNDWLRDHSVATLENRAANSGRSAAPASSAIVPGSTSAASTSPPADSRGFEQADTRREKIHSRLVGEFEGWDGETVFTLENGMVWKQDQTDHFSTKSMTNPEVTIKPGMFGSWRLSVDEYNKWVEVVRIQ